MKLHFNGRVPEDVGVVGKVTPFVDKNGTQLHIGDEVKVIAVNVLCEGIPCTLTLGIAVVAEDNNGFMVTGFGNEGFETPDGIYHTDEDGDQNHFMISLISPASNRQIGDSYREFSISVVED